MTAPVIVALRVVHVLASSFWLGAMLLNAGFLLPSTRAAGPAGGQVTRHLVQVRRLPVYLNLASVLAIVSGAVLYWWLSAGLTIGWILSRPGMAYTIGAFFTLDAAIVGQFVSAPTAAQLGRLGARLQSAAGPPPADALDAMNQLQLRLLRATQVAAALLALAAAAMAIGRYA
jgi:uncharacterized membrane protein